MREEREKVKFKKRIKTLEKRVATLEIALQRLQSEKEAIPQKLQEILLAQREEHTQGSSDKARESSQQDKELDAKDTFTYRHIANEKYLKSERCVPCSEFDLFRWITSGDISQLKNWKIISSILIAANSLLIVAIIFVIFINAWR